MQTVFFSTKTYQSYLTEKDLNENIFEFIRHDPPRKNFETARSTFLLFPMFSISVFLILNLNFETKVLMKYTPYFNTILMQT